MRILFHSSSISCNSGYGNVGRELVTRLKKEGHFVRVATKHMHASWDKFIDYERVEGLVAKALLGLNPDYPSMNNELEVKETLLEVQAELEGIEVFEGTNIAIINEMLEEENFSYIFTSFDIWMLHQKAHPLHEKWVSYTPVDTEWISKKLAETCTGTDLKDLEEKRGPSVHIAMSRHGERELKSIGLSPHYAPCGIDTKVFRPKPEGRKAVRDDFNLGDDNFLIGSVGLNYGDDRKGFIPLMQAFKVFHERHPEARLYIHSHAEGKYPGTVKYLEVIHKLGIAEWTYWPHQSSNDIGRIDTEWLCDTYNAFDVFCLSSRGEGFGLCTVEAQACGIPCIVSDNTTGPELIGEKGWLISCDELETSRWQHNGGFRTEPNAKDTLECLESAYNVWKLGDWGKLKKQVRENVLCYDWDNVWKKHWLPIFKELEHRLKHPPCEHNWADVTSRGTVEGREYLCTKCDERREEKGDSNE